PVGGRWERSPRAITGRSSSARGYGLAEPGGGSAAASSRNRLMKKSRRKTTATAFDAAGAACRNPPNPAAEAISVIAKHSPAHCSKVIPPFDAGSALRGLGLFEHRELVAREGEAVAHLAQRIGVEVARESPEHLVVLRVDVAADELAGDVEAR